MQPPGSGVGSHALSLVILCLTTKQKNNCQNVEQVMDQNETEDRYSPYRQDTHGSSQVRKAAKIGNGKIWVHFGRSWELAVEQPKVGGGGKFIWHSGLLQGLLEGADILKKAVQCVPEKVVKGNNPHPKNLYKSLIMSEVIQKIFRKHSQAEPYQSQVRLFWARNLVAHASLGGRAGTMIPANKVRYELHGCPLKPTWWGW